VYSRRHKADAFPAQISGGSHPLRLAYLMVYYSAVTKRITKSNGSLPDNGLPEVSGNKFAASHRFQMFNQHLIRALDHSVKPLLARFGDVKYGIFLNMEDKVTKCT